jgi:ABC-type hemin transport system ATPase subunit
MTTTNTKWIDTGRVTESGEPIYIMGWAENMTLNDKRIKEVIKQLEKLADGADELGLLLPNGAGVGSVLGSMAGDLYSQLERE